MENKCLVDIGEILVLVSEASPVEKWHVAYHSDEIVYNSTGPTHFIAHGDFEDDAEKKALGDAELIVAMRHNIVSLCRELQSARLVVATLVKAREEEYCNVPDYVDKALASYEEAVK